MTKKMRATAVSIGLGVAAILIGGLVLSGCAATHQDAPDPTAANTHPGTNEAVIQFPEGYRNVAFECHGSTGVYVTSRGVSSDVITSGIAVLANDPACK
jgi:hypothetical protein